MTDFPDRRLRIGTRTSPMALAQTSRITALLKSVEPDLDVEVVAIRTVADRWQGDLARLGGKGLFVKAIDARLQRGDVDMAIHCLKDVPGDVPLPDGLLIAAVPVRDDVRDALVVPADSAVRHLGDLPPAAVVGTSSVRRAAQLLRMRPDLRVVRVRGTTGTRVERLDGHTGPDGPLDALVLARAGLERLGMAERARQVFTVDEMLPAVGAGILALECRHDDKPVVALLERLGDERTMTEAAAERAMLQDLKGHCNSPIAGHCETGPDGLPTLYGMVFGQDGGELVSARLRGEPGAGPRDLGVRVAADLLRKGAADVIAAIPH